MRRFPSHTRYISQGPIAEHGPAAVTAKTRRVTDLVPFLTRFYAPELPTLLSNDCTARVELGAKSTIGIGKGSCNIYRFETHVTPLAARRRQRCPTSSEIQAMRQSQRPSA
jgi:hypothetical protein